MQIDIRGSRLRDYYEYVEEPRKNDGELGKSEFLFSELVSIARLDSVTRFSAPTI